MPPTPAPEASVTVALTYADFARLNRLIFLKNARVLFAFGAVMAIGLALAFAQPENRDVAAANPLVLVIPGSLLAMIFGFLPAFMYVSVRRQWRGTPALREPKTYTLTRAGLRTKGESYEGFAAWRNITQASRAGDLILLSIGPSQFHVIPIRAFETVGDRETFLALVRENVTVCGV